MKDILVGHVKRREGTENIIAVVKMKTEGKRPRRRHMLRWNDGQRHKRHESLEEEWAAGRADERCLQELFPRTETTVTDEKGLKEIISDVISALEKKPDVCKPTV